MTVSGIDIASYQSETYSTAGLAFVIIKATEGTGYVSPKYTAQLAHARAMGIVPGHYHFVRPGNMTAQADYFLKHATIKAGDLIAFDWEDTGVTGAEKDTWITYVEGKMPHNRVILYCNRDFWLNRDTTSFCGDGLWIADPDAAAGHPRVQHAWTFHQYSSTGGLDRNVGNFASTAALKTWAAKGSTPPVTTPKPPATTTPSKGATVATTQDMVNDLTRIGVVGSETKAGDVSTRTMHEAGWFLAVTLKAVQDLQAQVKTLQAAVDKLPKATS